MEEGLKKLIYNAPTEKWQHKSQIFSLKSGIINTHIPYNHGRITGRNLLFFDFPLEIRKIIYTINLIENLNEKIRKYTKNKMVFSIDEALKKSVFLSLMQISKKWIQPNLAGSNFKSIFSYILKKGSTIIPIVIRTA